MKYGEKLFSQTEEMCLAKKERTWCNMEGPSAASERSRGRNSERGGRCLLADRAQTDRGLGEGHRDLERSQLHR